MHIETNSSKAFELVTDALRDINLYKHSKDPEQLKSAETKLNLAMREDPEYLRPHYYRAMLQDLLGRPSDAVGPLEEILERRPAFRDELLYTLGLAYYHQYSWSKLDKAIPHFEELIRQSKNRSLRLLAKATLAQAYAMHMIPRNRHQIDAELIELIQRYFGKVKALYDMVVEEIENARPQHDKDITEETLREAEWSIHNARGMSIMYFTDYIGETEERVRLLKEALEQLATAQNIAGENWANHSDLGSCHMRLGYYLHSDAHFRKALDYLEFVVGTLRPEYGFALYEIGRTYRIQGQFDKALEYFQRALKVRREYRDVSDELLYREMTLAKEGSPKYP